MRNVAPTDKRVTLVAQLSTPELATVVYQCGVISAWIIRNKGTLPGWSVYTDEGCHAEGLKKADAVRTACNLLTGE